MEMTIQIPDALEQQLQQFKDRLPEVLERGLQAILAEETGALLHDEHTILDILTSQPTPEQVLALQPSPTFQARVSDLLQRSKQAPLTREEERELDRALLLEHLVRLVKAQVFSHTKTQGRGPDMKITYDSDVDALSIRFKETTVTTEHLTEGVALDYDADGYLAGIEILDASVRLNNPHVLRQVVLEHVGVAMPALKQE